MNAGLGPVTHPSPTDPQPCFKYESDRVREHFSRFDLNSELFLCAIQNLKNSKLFSPRIFTLYSKSLPLDLACRVWDVFCRDGEGFLFRTALGILKLFEDILTKMDFIHIAQFLTRLPEDLPAEEVFASIATIQMQSRNRKWAQVSGSSVLFFPAGSLAQQPPRGSHYSSCLLRKWPSLNKVLLGLDPRSLGLRLGSAAQGLGQSFGP